MSLCKKTEEKKAEEEKPDAEVVVDLTRSSKFDNKRDSEVQVNF